MTSRQMKWDAMAPVEDLRFRVRGIEAAQADKQLVEYLASANLRLVRLDDSASLTVRMTRFPELTFAFAQLPQAVVEWPRDDLSLQRAAILMCANGELRVESADPIVQRDPGLFLVPPGVAPVSIETLGPSNEVVYISAPAALVHELDLSTRTGPRSSVPSSALAPLSAFATTLSASPVGNAVVVGPLHAAASEVTRALGRLIAEGDTDELTLFARCVRLIVENYADPRLSVPRLARLAGVSERTLQAAFTAEGTTVGRELRAIRVRAARELKRRNPRIPGARIAGATGFGSTSSLYRALAAAESDLETGPLRRVTARMTDRAE